MFSERSERHHVPHFHAYYGEHVAVFSISPIALIIGFVPQRQQRLVEAWAELHEEELQTNIRALEMKITDVRCILLTGPCTNDRYLKDARGRRSAAFIAALSGSGFVPLGHAGQRITFRTEPPNS